MNAPVVAAFRCHRDSAMTEKFSWCGHFTATTLPASTRHENGDEFGNRNIGRSPMFEAAGRNDFFWIQDPIFWILKPEFRQKKEDFHACYSWFDPGNWDIQQNSVQFEILRTGKRYAKIRQLTYKYSKLRLTRTVKTHNSYNSSRLSLRFPVQKKHRLTRNSV